MYDCSVSLSGHLQYYYGFHDLQIHGWSTTVCVHGQFMYISGSTIECRTCHYSCDNTDRNKCTIQNDPSACIQSCSGGRKLVGGYCKCNLGTYDDESNNQCKDCYYTCSHKDGDYNSCDSENSETHCLICNSAKHRVLLSDSGPSKCMCQLGWFEETAGVEECKQCYYTCSTAEYNSCDKEDDEANCTKCDSVKHRILQSTAPSKCICNVGYFDDGNDHELCQACHYSCSHKAGDYDSCNGLDDDDCLICNGDKNRTMVTGNKCMCNIGYFDPGYEQC
eukprot:TRINITY_DN2953_c0_g1_i2.p4 TRINITY_DN2953_c0_g1~~TRINITY_DN2953_c0_g1_i2.p4  ORF type:complete len:278 (-),score=48.98 TRINITY_DN2953_c0_g1_i2:1759-2592(-)